MGVNSHYLNNAATTWPKPKAVATAMATRGSISQPSVKWSEIETDENPMLSIRRTCSGSSGESRGIDALNRRGLTRRWYRRPGSAPGLRRM